jgi:hypothetical protein
MEIIENLKHCFSEKTNISFLSTDDNHILFTVDNLSPCEFYKLTQFVDKIGFDVNVESSLEFNTEGLEIELLKKDLVKSIEVGVDLIQSTPNDMELGKAVRAIYNKSNG